MMLQSCRDARGGAANQLAAAMLATWLLAAGGAFAAESAASAPQAIAALTPGGTARVAKAIDGDTLALEDGRALRLAGIMAPKPPLDAAEGRSWPLAEAATAALAELAKGQIVTLAFDRRRTDRYGRLLAQLTREDGLWLQGELLARGMARVATTAGNRALAALMLAREAEAREARRGIWLSRAFELRAPEEARFHVESFEIVEGGVTATGHLAGRATLLLGADAKDGLTIALLPESRRLFRETGLDPQTLTGRRLRVRGFIRWWNGPLIEVSHPEQIELLEK